MVFAMSKATAADVLTATGDGVALRLKIVPGASRTKVVGMLGDRLKLAVAAPAEGGKANKAVCSLLAQLFDLPDRDVRITAGLTTPMKTAEMLGVSLCGAVDRLNQLLR